MNLLLILLTILTRPIFGQTVISGDAWVGGRMAVGASSATARLEIRESSSALAAFQVSGIDGTPFWVVNSSGLAGASVLPHSRLDINGSADNSSIGLMLRDGNMTSGSGSFQMSLGYNGTTNMRHAIATYHSTSAVNGSMDFYIWNTSLSQASLGSLDVMSLVVLSSASSNIGSMRVRPVASSTFTVQLEVSDGSTPGGGTIERAAEESPSSREYKTNITYLEKSDEERAYLDVRSMKLVEFRYKSFDKKTGELVRNRHQPLRRGVIFEEAPDSIKGPSKSITLDERVNNLEMAVKEFQGKLAATQAEADTVKGKP